MEKKVISLAKQIQRLSERTQLLSDQLDELLKANGYDTHEMRESETFLTFIEYGELYEEEELVKMIRQNLEDFKR